MWIFSKKHMILNVKGNKMAIRPRSFDLYILGEVFGEEVYTPRCKQITAPEVVLDLGANIGAFSVWAARKWDPGKIVAVEMEVDNFNILEENIRLNGLRGTVIPIKAAIWDKNEQVGITRHHFNCGKHQVCPAKGEDKVQALTMEKLMDLARLKKVDVLKMDIEGAEERILIGTNETIFTEGVGYLVAEIHPSKGVRVERIVEFLGMTGFEVKIRQQWFRSTLLLEAVNQRF